MSMKPPAPTTKIAFLFSQTMKKMTRHSYSRTKACELSGVLGGPAWEHLYICSESGTERRWGTEDRTRETGEN